MKIQNYIKKIEPALRALSEGTSWMNGFSPSRKQPSIIVDHKT